jgi:hypothetical protein
MNSYWSQLRPFEKRVVVGVAVLVFMVMNFWFVFPHFSDWRRAQARMDDAQKKLAKYETEIRQSDRYRSDISKLQGEDQDVPPEDQALHFASSVQSQAIRAGVNITSTGRLTSRTNDQFFVEQSEILSLQSREQQLVNFLYNLGSDASLIRVRDLSLRPDMSRQQLSASVKLVASYQRNLPKPAGATPPATGRPTPLVSKSDNSTDKTPKTTVKRP